MTDPETQPERTRLAWRRTVLASAAVTLLLARLAATHGAWPVVPIAVVIWVVGAVTAQARIARLDHRRTAVGVSLVMAVLVVVGIAVLGAVLVVVA
jgi:hypothetical protein